MSVSECPHCYMRVIFKADGTCPSCHRDPKDLTGTDLNLTIVTIRDTDRIPPVCMCCGLPTERALGIEKSRGNDRASSFFLSMLGLAAAVLGGLGFVKTGHHGESVSLTVPVCERCKRPPEPRHFSFERSTMTFVVPRRFREAFERENAS